MEASVDESPDSVPRNSPNSSQRLEISESDTEYESILQSISLPVKKKPLIVDRAVFEAHDDSAYLSSSSCDSDSRSASAGSNPPTSISPQSPATPLSVQSFEWDNTAERLEKVCGFWL